MRAFAPALSPKWSSPAVIVVVVAVVGFMIGRQFRSDSGPTEEAVVTEAAEPSATPGEPAPPARPAAPAPPRPRAAPKPSTPVAAPPPAEPAKPAEAVHTGAPPIEPTPPPPLESGKIQLAEGTKIVFTLNNSLSTKTNQPGDPFSGVVSRSVRVGDKIVIPEGSVVRGTAAHVERAGRVKGRSELGLRFDQLELPDGQVYQLSASLTELEETVKETVGEEGELKGAGSKKRDAATIGTGAAIGAVIGAISGRGKNAATGGAIGAGAATAVVLLTRGKDVELKQGTELAIQLDRPLAVTVK